MGNKNSSQNDKPAELIDGTAIAASIRTELKAQVAAMKEKHGKVGRRLSVPERQVMWQSNELAEMAHSRHSCSARAHCSRVSSLLCAAALLRHLWPTRCLVSPLSSSGSARIRRRT